MKSIYFIFFALIATDISAQPWKAHGPLQVSKENSHYLSHQDGTPFFWLADTGWEMLHRLNRGEIESYLENRKTKGLNVIQTVIISEFIHIDKVTNFYGDSIFVKENPDKPKISAGKNPENHDEYDFWDHVDRPMYASRLTGAYFLERLDLPTGAIPSGNLPTTPAKSTRQKHFQTGRMGWKCPVQHKLGI